MDIEENDQQFTTFHGVVDAFERDLEGQTVKLDESLDLLLKMFNNIGSNPMEQKFRKINPFNGTIKTKLFTPLSRVGDLLQLVGFTYEVTSQCYVLDDKHLG